MMEITNLRNIAIILIFAVLFGTSAIDKLKTMSVPEWFVKQFAGTFISKMPGGANLGYWLIAIFELALTLAFVASGFYAALLPYALTAALFLFAILLVGLRMISDFQGSANMFTYFGTTLISLYLVM